MLRLVLLAVLAAAAFPGVASAVTVLDNGHDPDASYRLPGARLAGPDAVLHTGFASQLRVAPLTGGPATHVGLPPLRGSTDVVAASTGRIVLAREAVTAGGDTKSARLLVGPPRGPFTPLARCGERAAPPVALDGDRVAYVALPRPRATCPPGTPTVERAAIVVRDIAAGGAPLAQLPVAAGGRDVLDLQLAGTFVSVWRFKGQGFSARPDRVRVVGFDGRVVTTLPRERSFFTRLDQDGTVVSSGGTSGGGVLRCLGVRTRLRVHAPGDATGRRIADEPCSDAAVILRDGRLRYGTPREDGYVDVVERELPTGARRVLATDVAGQLLDADERTLLVSHARCVGYDLLALAADAGAPTVAPGLSDCPFDVRARPRLRRGRLLVPIRCPDGCRALATLRAGGRKTERGATLQGGDDARATLALPLRGERRATLTVRRFAEVLRPKRRVFAVRPASRGAVVGPVRRGGSR